MFLQMAANKEYKGVYQVSDYLPTGEEESEGRKDGEGRKPDT
jgi:hypothetical protein